MNEEDKNILDVSDDELLDPVDIDLSDDNTSPEDMEPTVDVPELFEEVKEVKDREKELKDREEGTYKVATMDDYIEGTQNTNCRKCFGRGFIGFKCMPYGTKIKKLSKKARRKGKKEKSVPSYMRVKIPCGCMEKDPNAEIWKDEFEKNKTKGSSVSKASGIGSSSRVS